MSVFEYIIGAVLIVFSILIVLVVLFQEGSQANLGVISGAADSCLPDAQPVRSAANIERTSRSARILLFIFIPPIGGNSDLRITGERGKVKTARGLYAVKAKKI